MPPTSELEQLTILAQVDDLTQRVKSWLADVIPWTPARKSRLLISRVCDRVQTLRLRLESPLVVATFGGTGTGKSTLVNALVGQDVSESGRQRPTTTRPVLLVNPQFDVTALGLDESQFQIRRVDAPVLRDLVLIDCPDPDTSDVGELQGNLARLRAILPHCDVLVYVSTQQKYRSARIGDELRDAVAGCRLVFVQTHADQDSDIRDDWRRCLTPDFQVPDMFFVDSLRAISEQAGGHRPSGDFGRLLDLLTNQLGLSRRIAIRRANVVDLLEDSLTQCRDEYQRSIDRVHELQTQMSSQRQTLASTMTGQLKSELLQNRNLWERRLLSAVTDLWGFSPFSAVLRLYNGLGAFIASFSFFRARSSAQMALIGAVQGARWLKAKAEAHEADATLDRMTSLGISDQQLQESRLVVAGYVHAAQIELPDDADDRSLTSLRRRAAQVEGQFLGDARRAIDELIDELASRQVSWFTRVWYEFLFLAYVVFLIGRVGHNFFWSSFLAPIVNPDKSPEPLLTIDFYVPALIFLLLWSGVLVMAFAWRLRRGLSSRIQQLAASMVDRQLSGGLFPELEDVVRRIERDNRQLRELLDQATHFRAQLSHGTLSFGGRAQ